MGDFIVCGVDLIIPIPEGKIKIYNLSWRSIGMCCINHRKLLLANRPSAYRKNEKLVENGPRRHKCLIKLWPEEEMFICLAQRSAAELRTDTSVNPFFIYVNGMEMFQVPLTWELNGLHEKWRKITHKSFYGRGTNQTHTITNDLNLTLQLASCLRITVSLTPHEFISKFVCFSRKLKYYFTERAIPSKAKYELNIVWIELCLLLHLLVASTLHLQAS